MPTLESSCEFAAKQAAMLANVTWLTLSDEEKVYWGTRSDDGDAESAFKTRFIRVLIDMLGMSMIELE